MKHLKNILIIVVTLIMAVSCVPTTQFKDLQEKSTKLSDERDYLFSENEKLTVENIEMKENFKKNEAAIKQLEKDSVKRIEEIDRMREDYNKLKYRYDELMKSQNELVKGNEQKTKKLLSDLEQANEELQSKENELRELEFALNEKKKNLDNMRAELESRNARLIELEKILFRKDSVLNAIREKVADALLGFKDEGLTVTQKNGKVYVSLDEKLLFKSGSTEVDAKGKKALKKLAVVLAKNEDINIMIEGHTDNVPLKSNARMQDNWDLSVLRATAIVRILLESSKIDEERLTVAGRGEFHPVDPRESAEGRQKNRRTEIILTPKLDELFELLEQ